MTELSPIIIILSLCLVITSISAIELRNLKWATTSYIIQGVLLAAILVTYATLLPNHALYSWSVTVLLSKAIIIPLLLLHYVKKTTIKETPPGLNYGISLLAGILVMGASYLLIDKHINVLAPTPALAGQPYATNLSVACAILIFGLYALLSRRDILKIVIGVCLIENAVHLSLVSLAPTLPETAMIGVVTDVIFGVWILLIIGSGVYRNLGSTDIREMSKLQG